MVCACVVCMGLFVCGRACGERTKCIHCSDPSFQMGDFVGISVPTYGIFAPHLPSMHIVWHFICGAAPSSQPFQYLPPNILNTNPNTATHTSHTHPPHPLHINKPTPCLTPSNSAAMPPVSSPPGPIGFIE